MRENRDAWNLIVGLAIVLLIGFAVSFCISVRQDGLAETCSTWMVLPLLGILVAIGRPV